MDHRAFPLLLHTWCGRPTSRIVAQYFDEVAKLGPPRQPYFIITDAARAGRPDAAVRRLISERSAALAEQREALAMGSVVIVTNPLVRGALTAMAWFDASMSEIEYAPDLPSALMHARMVLGGRGIPWPSRADAL